MGTWGYDIFDNDVASDVRALFEDELNTGASVAHATAEILRESKGALDDSDDGPIVWLALAALQLQRKELQSNVRDHALAVIDGGADLARWEAEGTPEDVAGRKRVLEELGARLLGQK
jgi:hypothetical protein